MFIVSEGFAPLMLDKTSAVIVLFIVISLPCMGFVYALRLFLFTSFTPSMAFFKRNPFRPTYFSSTAKKSKQKKPCDKQIPNPLNTWLLCQNGNKPLPAIKDCLVPMSISGHLTIQILYGEFVVAGKARAWLCHKEKTEYLASLHSGSLLSRNRFALVKILILHTSQTLPYDGKKTNLYKDIGNMLKTIDVDMQ